MLFRSIEMNQQYSQPLALTLIICDMYLVQLLFIVSYHKRVYSTCVEHAEVSVEVEVEVFKCIGNTAGHKDIYAMHP